jgi:hypothetical protein
MGPALSGQVPYLFQEEDMPYVSEAQRGFFHANKEKLEKQGVNVSEWDRASAGKKLPARKSKKPKVNSKLRDADFVQRMKKGK